MTITLRNSNSTQEFNWKGAKMENILKLFFDKRGEHLMENFIYRFSR